MSSESVNAGLRRKDSKNALTTCHGVTDKGRACRRPIAGSKAAHGLRGASSSGAFVISQTAEDPAVFFCWQHKDQAELLNFGGSEIVEVNGRTSLEDAFSKLGLEEVDEEEEEESSKQPTPIPSSMETVTYDAAPRLPSPERFVRSSDQSPARNEGRPSYRRRHSSDYDRERRRDFRYYTQRKPNYMASNRDSGGFWPALLGGCFSEDDDSDELKPGERRTGRDHESHHFRRVERTRQARHSAPPEIKRKPVASSTTTSHGAGPGAHSVATPASIRQQRHDTPRRASDINIERHSARRHSAFDGTRPSFSGEKLQIYRDRPGGPSRSSGALLALPTLEDSRPPLAAKRPANGRSKSTPSSRNVAEWIPPPPVIMNPTERKKKIDCYAKLLTEMTKGPTAKDAPGYIYIFWQTDVEQTDAETAAAASLISTTTDRSRQSEEVILARRFFQTSANAKLPQREKRTIFLKIGRAVNVHNRLNQWQKQCQYNISLLRSYPFSGNGRAAPMVPYVGKVESCIHLELEMLGKRVKRQCRCGTEHREWFELDATPKAVREVDELVQKWIKWSQGTDWERRTPI